MNQLPIFSDPVKVGDIVESIHMEGKIKVEKVFDTLIVGKLIDFKQEVSWYSGTVILSFENFKK